MAANAEVQQVSSRSSKKASKVTNKGIKRQNFCMTFICNILLILELTSCSLVRKLINPPEILWHKSFLLGGFILKEIHTTRIESTHSQWPMPIGFSIHAVHMFVECWTGEIQA